MTIGERLKELRKQRGYSQEDVAKLLGIGRTTYLKYESGENKPSRKLKELASLFGVTTDYLLGREPAPAGRPAASESARERRDERDVQRRLESIREDLANADGLAFMRGEQMTEEDRELLLDAIESGLRTAKRLAKKYTPKKYKSDGK